MDEILKLETLTDNFGNDAEIFVQVLDIFLKEVPEDYLLLKKQVETINLKNIGEIAHKVKSSYRLLDMTIETMLLQQIEDRAKSQENTHEIPMLFEQFETNYDKGIAIVTFTRDYFKT